MAAQYYMTAQDATETHATRDGKALCGAHVMLITVTNMRLGDLTSCPKCYPAPEDTRYTFALIVYMAPGNGSRTYYGEGVHEWPQWCRTARGAWDFVKYAARELGPETLAVYRDGVKIGEYGRRGDEIMEWFGDSVGWDKPRDRRS